MVGLSFILDQAGRLRSIPVMAYRGIMADLLRRVADRTDPAAFRELYETYGPRVKAYMMRKGADAGTAEDLAQETLLTVWRKAALYAGDKGSMTTWVFHHCPQLAGSTGCGARCPGRSCRRSDWQKPPTRRCPTRRWPRSSGRYGCRPRSPSCRPISARSWCWPISRACRTARSQRGWRCRSGTVKSRMRIAYQKVRAALEDIE